jgi:hypothetical protein
MRQYGKLNRYLRVRPATHKLARKNRLACTRAGRSTTMTLAIRIHRKTFATRSILLIAFSRAAGRARHRQRYSPGFLRLLYNDFAGHIRMNRTGV